jgi:hypothetical protein
MINFEFMQIIEGLYINNIRLNGPRLSGFIFDREYKIILNLKEIFDNKNIYLGSNRYGFLPHYSVKNEINSIKYFNTFTSSKNTYIGDFKIKNIKLNNKIFDYTTPLALDLNDITYD